MTFLTFWINWEKEDENKYENEDRDKDLGQH